MAKTKKPIKTVKLNNTSLDREFAKMIRDPSYGAEYHLIHDILTKFPDNTDKNIVAMKIAAIDVTNSTHLSLHKAKVNLDQLAKFVCSINFDERVKNGDLSLVNEFCKGKINVNLFSFATKYCHYHNSIVYGEDAYAKYDKIMSMALPEYAKACGVLYKHRAVTTNAILTLAQTNNNQDLNKIIDEVLDRNKITTPNRKAKFDILMWFLNR